MTARSLIDPEKTQITVKLGVIIATVGFIIWATLAVSTFMHEMRAFQKDTTEALEENKQAHTP